MMVSPQGRGQPDVANKLKKPDDKLREAFVELNQPLLAALAPRVLLDARVLLDVQHPIDRDAHRDGADQHDLDDLHRRRDVRRRGVASPKVVMSCSRR